MNVNIPTSGAGRFSSLEDIGAFLALSILLHFVEAVNLSYMVSPSVAWW